MENKKKSLEDEKQELIKKCEDKFGKDFFDQLNFLAQFSNYNFNQNNRKTRQIYSNCTGTEYATQK